MKDDAVVCIDGRLWHQEFAGRGALGGIRRGGGGGDPSWGGEGEGLFRFSEASGDRLTTSLPTTKNAQLACSGRESSRPKSFCSLALLLKATPNCGRLLLMQPILILRQPKGVVSIICWSMEHKVSIFKILFTRTLLSSCWPMGSAALPTYSQKTINKQTKHECASNSMAELKFSSSDKTLPIPSQASSMVLLREAWLNGTGRPVAALNMS